MRCGRCAETILDGRVYTLTLLHVVGSIDDKPIGESVQLTLHADCCAELKGFYRQSMKQQLGKTPDAEEGEGSQSQTPTTIVAVIGTPSGGGGRKN